MLYENVVECGRTYLKIEHIGEDDYRLKMLAINSPGNMVPIQLRVEDGKTYIFFNISDYQNMMLTDVGYKYKQQDYDEIFESVENVCVTMEEYLLPFEDLVLDPENIYRKKGRRQELVFLYNPGGENVDQVRALVEYLLDHADYSDENAVKCVYSLYQKTREKGFDLNGLRQSIRELNSGEDIFAQVKSEQKRPSNERIMPIEQAKEEKRELLSIIKNDPIEVVKSLWAHIKDLFIGEKENNDKSETKEKVIVPETEYVSRSEDEYKTELLSATTIRGGVYALRSKSSARKDILLLEYPYFIGKDKNRTDFEIDDASVSRYHARIDKNGDSFYITDLNSTNGSFLNRIRLKPFEKTEIKEGDSIIFSHCEYVFSFLY